MSESNKNGEINFINCSEITLEKTNGGFVSLTFSNGTAHERVNFYRSFPLTMLDELISVRDVEKNEIGIIRNLSELKAEYQDIIKFDLNRRYFTPEITKISTVKDEYGYVYMDVDTTSGEKHITVPNGSANFVRLSEIRLILVDIDGNRFSLTDYTRLDEKSVRLLETLI